MDNIDFIPVLIGSDANVYGMARAFHEEYGKRSIAVSKTILMATAYSKIIDFVFEPDLENEEKFIAILIKVAKQNNLPKLLIPCGDGYVKLLVKNQDKLRQYYNFNCPSLELLQKLSMKDSFYALCDEFSFSYPKTTVISPDNFNNVELNIEFPVIIKASNSVEYWKCSFNGKMKVFKADNYNEFLRICEAIYNSSYNDTLTIQEFIPGDDSFMRVLNCYCGTDKKVKLMAMGHALLEEHTPQGIGSYVAIINTFDKELLDKFQNFLEKLEYTGFANFDMKYDYRDNTYKFFETNIRQGRSSYYVTASGYNLAKWIVDDVMLHKPQELTYAKNECLWLQVPKGIVYKYLSDDKLKAKVRMLIKEGRYSNSLFYKKDLSPKRYLRLIVNSFGHYKKYKKYYGQKGLNI